MNGLAGLIGAATAYDLWAWRKGHETLSCGFKRTYRHPVGRLALGAVLGALVLHLFEE